MIEATATPRATLELAATVQNELSCVQTEAAAAQCHAEGEQARADEVQG
jgi:hypothetical protein